MQAWLVQCTLLIMNVVDAKGMRRGWMRRLQFTLDDLDAMLDVSVVVVFGAGSMYCSTNKSTPGSLCS